MCGSGKQVSPNVFSGEDTHRMTTVGPEGLPALLVLDLADDGPSLGAIRQSASAALNDISDDAMEDVLLVLTELVSNAFDHGRHPRRVRLWRSEVPCSVRVEVDDGTGTPPIIGQSRLGGYRGRGLVIIESLSTVWGTTEHQAGKTVWAEIACTPLARPPQH